MTEKTETTVVLEPHGWVFYDARCNFCVRRARQMASFLGGIGYSIAPFQADWVAARLGRAVTETPTEMIVLTREGAIIGGIDSLLHLARCLWWTRMLSLPAMVPGVRHLLGVIYRIVARHRYRLWGRCSSAGCAVSPLPHGRGFDTVSVPSDGTMAKGE